MEESYVYRQQKKLRRGYTTGTCAAAASLAAAALLLQNESTDLPVTVDTPKGIRLDLEAELVKAGEDFRFCRVQKDGGDDPDVTSGMWIYARVGFSCSGEEKSGWIEYKNDKITLYLSGGVGIGVATKPGLSCKVGEYAINPVPRAMIFQHVEKVCRSQGFEGTLWVEISAPEGEERGKKTFNSRLGILGGISILGTSGIVEPMSQEALLKSIELEITQKVLEGCSDLVMVPGNYGLDFAAGQLGLNLGEAVKCSNFLGASIDMAVQAGAKGLLLIGHMGKLVKLAAGIMNTHSREADGRMEILAAYSGALGAPPNLIRRILDAVTVDQALNLMEEADGLLPEVMEEVTRAAYRHLKKRAGEELEAEAILFTNERGILGKTPGADRLLARIRENKTS
ncbi:MAG TPA: cobalt-precorrin-5B (C(1))-methyltransferase CbiD [Candidatus Enterocloster faecavium]|uniref:Cobalt-precorrin-5B C(1)-methyltransferase n=1 Tax=Candidatus Enterocloster faecavium TaxID=2838560 RepID=A0A9D2RM93_9FIRM|nr:cobalt-precorrin-5B (C(1))-methyltransferase CbiD [Candidatus Enterocloster faecavium]